ncbi:hypothetical protein [Legionella clemsonensis]|uniref:Uncharacterized protein n=1 Tax=Legionella clemsonensis TaxID=1867846 RepID=A0A222P038_9GAMM|nr:hypothetical protein [Legionella clemsonensis]ASQ45186.1 hypothetical protein clem_03140 [Legionella clemsonensis]
MDEKENETLEEDILEGIKENVRPLLLPIDKLTKKASRYPELSSTIELLMQAEQQIQQALHTKKVDYWRPAIFLLEKFFPY